MDDNNKIIFNPDFEIQNNPATNLEESFSVASYSMLFVQ